MLSLIFWMTSRTVPGCELEECLHQCSIWTQCVLRTPGITDMDFRSSSSYRSLHLLSISACDVSVTETESVATISTAFENVSASVIMMCLVVLHCNIVAVLQFADETEHESVFKLTAWTIHWTADIVSVVITCVLSLYPKILCTLSPLQSARLNSTQLTKNGEDLRDTHVCYRAKFHRDRTNGLRDIADKK